MPELADICNLETEKLFGVFSENMGPEQYIVLAERIGEAIRDGWDGVVVGHGTDTMHHTAAALSFMVQHPPVPIIMVGSQRSSDRPSSDAAQNLISATWAAAHGPIAEVMVCMFGPTSDRYNLLHRGHPRAQDAHLLPQHLPHAGGHPARDGRARRSSRRSRRTGRRGARTGR